jgi:hypothetical protein
MTNRTMSGHEALTAIRPHTRRDWKAMWGIISFTVFAVVVGIALFIFHQKDQEYIARTWQSATATIEDVRPVIASRVESNHGGAMLYQLEVLVDYSANDSQQRRWIRIKQQPTLLADAQLKIFRWKGQQCIVRWPASQPDHAIAEVN